MKACVINLPERSQRLIEFKEELKYIGSPKLEVIPGVKLHPVHRGIGQAHLNCIKYAKNNDLEYVLIMEDDCYFPAKEKTLKYFMESFNNAPPNWDVLLGGVYYSENIRPFNEHWNKIGEFCGLHFYIVNKKAYDVILGYDFYQHIDRWMNQKNRLNCYVANKFFALQKSGFSDNTGQNENYTHLLHKCSILRF